MNTLVEAVVGVVVISTAATGSVALRLRSRLRRSLRLVPGRRVEVPWNWRWSPRRAAVLHRRLQRSCQIVLAATGGTSAYQVPRARRLGRRRADADTSILQTTGRALLDQAVTVDRRLIAADRGGAGWRRLHLPGLTSEVNSVEASCLRLAQLARVFDEHLDTVTGRAPAPSPHPEVLLDAMEAAIAELRREEQGRRVTG